MKKFLAALALGIFFFSGSSARLTNGQTVSYKGYDYKGYDYKGYDYKG